MQFSVLHRVPRKTPDLPSISPGENIDSGRLPRVSVVLCTFNGAQYIADQLSSILAQSYAPHEVIVSDDGSVDQTLRIVADLAASTSVPVRIVNNPARLGYSDNFISACRLAEADYLALSDQDDFWYPTKLERQVAAMRRTGAAMCAHDVELMDSQDRPIAQKRRLWAHRTRLVKPLHATPWGNFKGFTLMFDPKLLDLIPADERGLDTHVEGDQLPHDRWLYFLASTFTSMVFLSDRLARYRQHDAQVFGATDARSLRERIETKRRAGERQARYLESVAGHRAQMLRASAPQQATREWTKAQRRWEQLSAHLSSSARLYERPTVAGRLLIVAQNALRRVYLPFRFGGLGFERLVEDIVMSFAIVGKPDR